MKLLFGPGGWMLPMQLVQVVASAATAVLARRIALRLLGPGRWLGTGDGSAGGGWTGSRTALAAGYAVALWPPLIFYSVSAYSLTFEALAIAAIVLLLIKAGASHRLGSAAQAGVVYGLLAYALPAFLGSLVLVPAGLRAMGVPWRRAAAQGALALLVALAVVSPWTVRNAVVHHRLVPVATNLGFNYLGGQNPYSRPSINVLCTSEQLLWKVIDRQALETMNEADFDRMLLRQGLEFALHNPWLTVRRSAVRLAYYWWGNPDVRLYNPLRGLASLILMCLALPLFLVGLIYAVRQRRRFGLILAVFGWQSLFYMNFAIRGRYALAIHPLFLIIVVFGAAQVVCFLRGRQTLRGDPQRGG
jgi:hypothetical protein